MSSTNAATINRIALSRLLWAALLAIVAASLANLIVYLVADALLSVTWEPKFNAMLVVVGTIGALVVAAAVFAVVARVAKNPVKTYTMIATIALLFSFATPVLALFGIPGPSVAPLDTVMVMILTHIIAFVVSTFIFTRLTRAA
jgi:Family of unknown function (DUF6069)